MFRAQDFVIFFTAAWMLSSWHIEAAGEDCATLADTQSDSVNSANGIPTVLSDYAKFDLTRLMPVGKSEAEAVRSPFDGSSLKPERHLYLKMGDPANKRGDVAVAHDIVNGQVIRREALIAEFVDSAGQYRLKIVLELYDKDGNKIIDPALAKKEKSKCFRCHSIDRKLGHLLLTDTITHKPLPGKFVYTAYGELPEIDRLQESHRRVRPIQ